MLKAISPQLRFTFFKIYNSMLLENLLCKTVVSVVVQFPPFFPKEKTVFE